MKKEIKLFICIVPVILFFAFCFFKKEIKKHYSNGGYYCYYSGDSLLIVDAPLRLNQDSIDSLDLSHYTRYMVLGTDNINKDGDLTFFYPKNTERHKYVCVAWLPYLGEGGPSPKYWTDERVFSQLKDCKIRYLQVPRRYRWLHWLLYFGRPIEASIFMIVDP